MSRTRIVATIGPATCSAERLRELVAAGMNVARLNGSHANHAWHKATIALLRATVPEVPILLDIPGRKIRTAALAHEPRFSCGDRIILTTDTSHDGREKVPVNYAGLHQDVKSGNQILLMTALCVLWLSRWWGEISSALPKRQEFCVAARV